MTWRWKQCIIMISVLDLPPPPAVVFSTELEVDHDDGDLRAGDGEDDEDQEEEAEQVVELVLVDGGEDEEELDEAGAEREDAGHDGADSRVHVPHLGWHLGVLESHTTAAAGGNVFSFDNYLTLAN